MMRPEIEIDGPPETRAIYRTAALGMGKRRGTELPDLAYVWRNAAVNPNQLSAYAKVCGFEIHVLPPTYPHIMAFPLAMQLMALDSFPLPVVGLIHVANWMRVGRPVHPSERLTIRVCADDLRPHDRGTQFDLVASATIGTEEVWSSRSTYLRRAKTSTPRPAERDPAPPATATWTMPARLGREYARASGDRNPIHTSRIVARLFGFRRPIAHGMWSKARCLAALDRPEPPYSVDVQFKLPILLPAVVAWSTDGKKFGLHDAATGKPHLTGALSG